MPHVWHDTRLRTATVHATAATEHATAATEHATALLQLLHAATVHAAATAQPADAAAGLAYAEEDALLQAAAGAPSVAASRRGQTPQLRQLQQSQVDIPLLQAAGPNVQQSRKEAAVAGVVK